MASSNFVSWVNRTPVRDLTWPPPVKQWNTQFIRKALDDPDWISLTRVSFKRDAFSRNRRIAKDKANKIASSVRSKFWNSSGFQSNLNLLMRNSNFESFSRHLIPHYFDLESFESKPPSFEFSLRKGSGFSKFQCENPHWKPFEESQEKVERLRS